MVFPCDQVISAASAGAALTLCICFDIPGAQHVAQVIIFAFARPYVKVLVNVKSCMAGIAGPAAPGVKLIVVYPIGIDQILFTSISSNSTVVVGVIFKLIQDCKLL
jgi:hypothetical protein